MELLKEFKPALVFLGTFLALYFAGNILYGVYIEFNGQKADAITHLVTEQSSWFLNLFGYDTRPEEVAGVPKVALKEGSDVILLIYEGCNGINVMIVFIAFLIAFGGPVKSLFVFLPAGLVAIHIFNLLRIALLFDLAFDHSTRFYYYHKYFFTATLYLVVLALWAVWVIWFNGTRNVKATA